ncbi:putative membrane protein precursor [Photobacterium aphoticum]|uniref:Putative membrane protein n=1 Tax=Photobacterium aphoticum TaxID=754436 RepID=A0A090QNB1_9GAMM|nr:putative membrane protein precursor [Photobacterium aphoticum]
MGVDTEAKVPYDTVLIKDGKVVPQYYVNTTEIGLYLNILVEVEKAGNADALVRIAEVLDTLEKAPTWNGLFFWPYDIVKGELKPTAEGIVPAVDNGNLAFALAGVAGAYLTSEAQPNKPLFRALMRCWKDKKPVGQNCTMKVVA